jgi:hypothetical protein
MSAYEGEHTILKLILYQKTKLFLLTQPSLKNNLKFCVLAIIFTQSESTADMKYNSSEESDHQQELFLPLRLLLKKYIKRSGMVVNTYNPSTGEAETEEGQL